MNCLPGNHHCGSGPCNMLSNQFIKDIVYKELSQQVYQFRSGIEYKEQIDKEVQAFQRFIEGDKDEIIDREVAGQFNTLNHHLSYLDAIDKLVTQDSGVVTVNGYTRKTMAQIAKDSEILTYRPTTDLSVGICVFDTTLNKPIWWNGVSWVDSTGTVV